MSEQAHFRYDLGKGLFLDAYSIDPEVGVKELSDIVSSRDGTGKLDFDEVSKDVEIAAHLDSLKGLKVNASDKQYVVPRSLRHYRQALEGELLRKGKNNGPIAIIDGKVDIPLMLCNGGYFDFLSTGLEQIPGDLLPDEYPAGKTIRELMLEWGMVNDQRARFLAFIYLMESDNEEMLLIHRSKEVAVAPNCIASPGSTPSYDEGFIKPDFNFEEHYWKHMEKEVEDEFKVKGNEFKIKNGVLIEDRVTTPCASWRLSTPLTTMEIVKRMYGEKSAIAEHPIIYSFKPEVISSLTERFDMWPSTFYLMNQIEKGEM